MISGRLLSQFIAVAEELHFGRAALRLNMAQPPLSQAIKRLESIVGVPLLIRDKHYVALTAAGTVFLLEARELQARTAMAIEASRRASKGYTGRIAVGFVGSVSYELLPRVISSFTEKYPAIHVDLKELTSAEQLESLRAGKIDLGILRLPLSNTQDTDIHVIGAESMIAALPEKHRLAGQQSLMLEELSRDLFINFPADKVPHLHTRLLSACEDAGFSPNVVTEVWQIASILSLVGLNMGIALLPAQVRSCSYPGVVFKNLTNKSSQLELRIAAASRTHDNSPIVSAMLSVISEQRDINFQIK